MNEYREYNVADLSERDRLVLDSVFNPNLPFEGLYNNSTDSATCTSPIANIANTITSDRNTSTSSGSDSDVSTARESDLAKHGMSLDSWRSLEKRGIEAAEKGDLDEALMMFSQAIDLCPSDPAGYNNRAQLSRLKGDINSARTDLDRAIDLSQGQGVTASKAFVQRAMIKRLEGDDQGCMDDFKSAAKLGSPFAKQQLIALNPYAALCNSMLGEMMTKIRQGQPENSGDPAA